MERRVGRAEFPGVAGRVPVLQQGTEPQEVVLGAPPRREPRRLHVVGLLELEDVAQRGPLDAAQQRARVDRAAHVRAVAPADLQHTDVAQRPDRLAHGRTAHREPGGEIVLAGNPVPDRPVSRRELPLHLVDHRFDRRRARNRFKCCHVL